MPVDENRIEWDIHKMVVGKMEMNSSWKLISTVAKSDELIDHLRMEMYLYELLCKKN